MEKTLLGYYMMRLQLHLLLFAMASNLPRVLTIHGSMDETVPEEDAFEFAKFISNHELRIIKGADHEYTCHQDELSSLVLEFIKVHNDKNKDRSKQTQFRRVDNPIHSRF